MSKRVVRDVVCILSGVILLVLFIVFEVNKGDNKVTKKYEIKENYEKLNDTEGKEKVEIKKDVFDNISYSYLSDAIKEDENVVFIGNKNDNSSRIIMNLLSKLIDNYGIESIDYLAFDELSDDNKFNLMKLISYDKAPIILFIEDNKILSGMTNEKESFTEEEVTSYYGNMESLYIETFDIACDEDC